MKYFLASVLALVAGAQTADKKMHPVAAATAAAAQTADKKMLHMAKKGEHVTLIKRQEGAAAEAKKEKKTHLRRLAPLVVESPGEAGSQMHADAYHGQGYCGGGVNTLMPNAQATPLSCWTACEAELGGSLVAIDAWRGHTFGFEDFKCFCQDKCDCMMNVGLDEISVKGRGSLQAPIFYATHDKNNVELDPAVPIYSPKPDLPAACPQSYYDDFRVYQGSARLYTGKASSEDPIDRAHNDFFNDFGNPDHFKGHEGNATALAAGFQCKQFTTKVACTSHVSAEYACEWQHTFGGRCRPVVAQGRPFNAGPMPTRRQ